MTPCYLVVYYRRFEGNYCLRLLVTRSVTLTIERTVGSGGRFTGRTKKMATNTKVWEGPVCVCGAILFVGHITAEDRGTTLFRNVGNN
jgi:hypothetical protein